MAHLQTPPNELMVPSKEALGYSSFGPLTPLASVPMSRETSDRSNLSLATSSQVNVAAKKHSVNLIKPVEPSVTYLEILKFVVWSMLVVVTQLCRDVASFKFYRPLLAPDFMTHYFVSRTIFHIFDELTLHSIFP